MTSFTPILNQELEQGKLMRSQIHRNKVPKHVRSILCNRLKFGMISREDLLYTKMEKMDFENLIIVAL